MRADARGVEVVLEDGRLVRTPLAFYPSLVAASPRVRARVRLIALGTGLEWPDLDLQLSVAAVIEGRREHVPPADFKRWLRERQAALGLAPLD